MYVLIIIVVPKKCKYVCSGKNIFALFNINKYLGVFFYFYFWQTEKFMNRLKDGLQICVNAFNLNIEGNFSDVKSSRYS